MRRVDVFSFFSISSIFIGLRTAHFAYKHLPASKRVLTLFLSDIEGGKKEQNVLANILLFFTSLNVRRTYVHFAMQNVKRS